MKSIDDMTRDELKQLAADLEGLGHEFDLRSKTETLRAALKEAVGQVEPASDAAATAETMLPPDEVPTTSHRPLSVPVPPVKKVQKYRVCGHAKYVVSGMVYQLPPDSVVSSQTHNMDEIRRQNVPLEPID